MTVSRPDRHEARSSYPTGLTDAEWHVLAPHLPTEKPRDERNEYHGITVERAQKVLEAVGESLRIQVEDKPLALA